MKKHTLKSQILLNALFVIFCVATLIPFVLLLSISFSNEQDIALYGYSLFPKTFDLSAYKYVFKNPEMILRAYGVTGAFSSIGMVLSVSVMSMLAYPLSRKNLRGRRFLSFYLYFTMLFSGGLVPSYILITQYLHLGNNFLVYIIPGLIVPWYVFLIRTFFQGIPQEIVESAYVDGASEYTIFLRIVVPLSKPVFATIALFVFLAKWNDWNTSMLYMDDPDLFSLQYMLQRIMRDIKILTENVQTATMVEQAIEIPSETVRMAMAVIVAGPALIIFPFFQKYFVKGITVGSVKG